jgi:CTP-dependent riboflavin kinase
MKITGTIKSGVGKGAFFTQVDWVVRQCEELLGYKPFPGTLNVHVRDEDLDMLEEFFASHDCALVPDDPKFCAANVKKVKINGITAAVVLPSEDVRVHENRVIELIASCSLKEELGLGDGDAVTIEELKAS